MDVPIVSIEQAKKEKEGEESLPLIPLTIPCQDHSPPPATTLPTLHMSGGMVTMAVQPGTNKETSQQVKYSKPEKETETNPILPKSSK